MYSKQFLHRSYVIIISIYLSRVKLIGHIGSIINLWIQASYQGKKKKKGTTIVRSEYSLSWVSIHTFLLMMPTCFLPVINQGNHTLQKKHVDNLQCASNHAFPPSIPDGGKPFKVYSRKKGKT